MLVAFREQLSTAGFTDVFSKSIQDILFDKIPERYSQDIQSP
jgi:hypothetical protein